MRVVLFVNGYPDPGRPHYCVYNRYTAERLARLVDLTVVVPMAWRPGRRFRQEDPENGFRLVRVAAPMLPGGSRVNVRLFQRVARSALVELFAGTDIVHSVGLEFAGLVAARILEERPRPHVAQVISDPRNMRSPSFDAYPFVDSLRKRVDALLCNSATLAVAARSLIPEAKTVRTAYRGTDLDLFEDAGPRAEFSEAGVGTRFLFLGGLPPYPDRRYGENTKGGRTLMEAWARAEGELRRHRARLVFGGPAGDSESSRAWRATLADPEAVTLAGRVPPESVRKLLAESDVVLIPSLEEGCPNLAFEALASGRPILGSGIGPILEVLGDSGAGWTVRAGDAEAWSAALVRACEPSQRDEVVAAGRSARRRAEAAFDSRQYANLILELYRETIPRSDRSAGEA